MGQCVRCNKRGIFLRVNKDGLCGYCEKEVEFEKNQRAMAECRERERARREALEAEKNLPRFPIKSNGEKKKIQAVSFLKELTYSSITAKSDKNKLGNFVVLDTETTGLSVSKNDVVEVAAVKYVNLSPVEVFQSFVRPPHGITEEAKLINGITEEMVADAPMLYEIIPSLQLFIYGQNLVAHNAEFDFKFLCRAGLDIQSEKRKYFDTKLIAQKFLKKPKYKYDEEFGSYLPDLDSDYDVDNHKLETLCSYYGITRSEAHRALGDCLDTGKLFKALVDDKIG